VNRHAKAPSSASGLRAARSATRRATGLGRIFRGAFACAVVLAALAGIGAPAAIAQNPPVVTVTGSSEVAYTTAKLEGEVNPEGEAGSPETFFHFEVSADNGGGEPDGNWIFVNGNPDGVIEAAEGAEEANPVAVEGIAEFLQPNTTYYFRLAADNAEFANHSETGVPFPSFTTGAVTPPVVTIDPVTSFDATTAQLSGTVDPGNADHAFDASWHFEYSTDDAVWTELETHGPLEGAGAQAVQAEATGLQPNKHYFVRLLASNLGGQSVSEAPDPDFTTDAAPPSVTTGAAPFAGDASIRKLTGTVNPNNLSTVYWFEYGTADCSANPCASAPASQDAFAGSGGEQVSVERFVNALSADTTYHYRLMASNDEGTTAGSDLTFRTPPADGAPGDGFLPDNRGWELVSATEKHGLEVMGSATRTHAAAGESPGMPAAVAFASLGGFADVNGTGVATEYMGQRTARAGTAGWSVHGITPPQQPTTFFALFRGLEPLYLGDMSPDLTKGLFRAWSPLTDAPNVETVENLYRRNDLRTPGFGSWDLLSDAVSPLSPPDPLGPTAIPFTAAATADFQHVLFESKHPLTADASGLTVKLYKSDGVVTRLVAASSTCPGASASSTTSPCSGAGLGATAPKYTPRVLSADGSRAIFSAPIDATGNLSQSGGAVSKLFQLDDRGTLDRADDALIHVSASEKASPGVTRLARYQSASADGSRIFFQSDEELTDSGSGSGLYLWERQPTDEQQSLEVDATGGTFTLTFHSQTGVGTGNLSSGSNQVSSLGGSFVAGQAISGNGIPPGTTILAYSGGTLTLSQNATSSGNETLRASTDATTAALAHDASAGQVQSALESLPAIGAGNVAVSGGPGPGAPYQVTFTGALAGVDVQELSADSSGLSGGASTATVTTSHDVRNLTLVASSVGGGVIGASEDGHRVYFASAGAQLIPGGPTVNNIGLYYWQDNSNPAGTLSFVGEVTGGDMNWLINQFSSGEQKRSRVTPDGRAMLFEVVDGDGLAPGYDQHSACPSTQECSQVYVYRAESSQPLAPDVVCASCNPTGAPATTDARVSAHFGTSGTGETWHVSHALSDDGRRVFFTSGEKLVPGDSNGKRDVYEYDVPTGTVQLLSSGRDTNDSYFLDASADGHDAYFITRARLVGWDTDRSYDLYDARVDGGFPEPPPAALECISNESCKAPSAPAPAEAAMGSSLVAGPGDHRRPRCNRGQRKVRRGGKVRCLKKHRRRDANGNRRAGR
jgi:hypothetical protein